MTEVKWGTVAPLRAEIRGTGQSLGPVCQGVIYTLCAPLLGQVLRGHTVLSKAGEARERDPLGLALELSHRL